MRKGIVVGAALLAGTLFGACVRNVVINEAHAQGAGRVEYKVVGGSISNGGYEEDLNKMSAEGWKYTGAIPVGNGAGSLIFERQR